MSACRKPDWKATLITEELSKKNIKDSNYTPAMLAYREYKKTGNCDDTALLVAFHIYEDELQKEIIEALLLSGCPYEEAQNAFELPVGTLAVYEELFFDKKIFITRLDKLSYVHSYADEQGKALKLRAIDLGYEYILFVYSGLIPRTAAQKEIVNRLFMTSAYKAMNINYSSLNSSAQKMALEHAKIMMKAYEELQKLNEDNTDTSYDILKVIPTKSTVENITIGELI